MGKVKKLDMMLTTIDNPFDPFTQFQDWYTFDCGKRYGTYNYLDRIVTITKDMNQEQIDQAYNEAMKEIVAFNPELYKLVTKEVEYEKDELFV